MCLVTKIKKVKIAKRDITVWKILNEDLSTIFQENFQYNKGELVKSSFSYDHQDGHWKVFNNNIRKKLNDKYPRWSFKHKGMMCIARGLHSVLTKKDAIRYSNEGLSKFFNAKVFKAVIPKGSEYYKDGFGQIVSNQLIIL